MSLFYNRDRNISGANILTGLVFDPSYGSSAVFSTNSNYVSYSDKIANIVPLGVNNVFAEYSLNFPLRKQDAQDLVNFYESQSGTGVVLFNDNSNIYRTLSGTIDSLSSLDSQNNDKFNVNLKFSVERNSSVLNWSGQSFVDHQFQAWDTGVNYGAYDVVYFENDLEEPVNNFFYCLGDHNSSVQNHPLSTGQKWTNSLFLDSNGDFSFQQTPSVSQNAFKGSFRERINDQKNIHAMDKFEFAYKNISDKKTKSLLHFLESRMGVKKFQYSLPQIYDKPKIFFAPIWEHQWNAKDSNNLKISATEDPLGIIPSGNPALSLIQESGYSSLSFAATGVGRMFFDTGNGKELLTGTSSTLVWPSSGIRHQAKIWGRLAGFTGSGQGLLKTQFSSAKNLTNLNLSGNNISTLNLYGEVGLRNLICPNNNIGNLDVSNKPQLSYVDYSNNLGGSLNVGGSTNLTGLIAPNNRFSALYVDSSLSGLVAGGKYSGHANFSGSSGISNNSLVSTLTGRGWTINYNYSPLPAATPDNIPSTSTSWPSYSEYLVSVDNNHDGACSLLETVQCFTDSTFESSVKFNFPNESDVAEYAIGEEFYIQYNNKTMKVIKICCDIADFVSGPVDCVVSPSIVINSPSTSAQSNSFPSDPCFSPSSTVGSFGSVSL